MFHQSILSITKLILQQIPRLEDAHQSEARGLLWGGVQLAGEAEKTAGCPSALSGHADLFSRGWETAQTGRHQTVASPVERVVYSSKILTHRGGNTTKMGYTWTILHWRFGGLSLITFSLTSVCNTYILWSSQLFCF